MYHLNFFFFVVVRGDYISPVGTLAHMCGYHTCMSFGTYLSYRHNII